ncbi:MAG: transporter [Bacteroidetes bacterium 43-16]|nr:MAG: transporter [Bacteroidetes bacterium 43-16]
MMNGEQGIKSSRILFFINVLVVFWVSSNLRAPITSVGPVLTEISAALDLSHFQSSLLTSIPLLMFAGFSIIISRIAAGRNISHMLLTGLIILGMGTLLRVYGNVFTLLSGSVLVGLGICIGNVVTPGYIKSNLPGHIGIMTGLFAVAMNLTAAFASGFSINVGKWTDWHWRGSIGIWIGFVAIAILIILMELSFKKRKTLLTAPTERSSLNLFRSRQAWQVSIFLGLQSVIYYSIVSWLPSVLVTYGIPEAETGWVLFTFQISTLPITFIGPVIANKMKDQRAMIIFIAVLMLSSILLFAWHGVDYAYPAAILLGISNGLAFSLSLLFFSIKTKSSATAIKLSGMAQSIGYFIAAFGPAVFGALHDTDASWKVSFYFLAFSVALLLFFGLSAARNRFVEDH